jgi:hypothetical protein
MGTLSFAFFAGNFAIFAVKIFNRKGRKGVAKFAKDSSPCFLMQCVMF